MHSYVAVHSGLRRRFAEFGTLLKRHRARGAGEIRRVIDEMEVVEERIRQLLGRPVCGLDLLEIGSGQIPLRLAYWSYCTRAIGIDLDVEPQGWRIGDYVRQLRDNGSLRLAKTVIRKAIGTDRHLMAALAARLGGVPAVEVRRMNAERVSFADTSFDVVYSRCTYEHLPDPARVTREIVRVLRPGGVLYVGAHLWTSDSGCHDSRVLSGRRGGLPAWAHLRPSTAADVAPNVYVNRLRLADWRNVMEEVIPGAREFITAESDPQRPAELASARAAGDLRDYTDEELLTVGIAWAWRKPGPVARTP